MKSKTLITLIVFLCFNVNQAFSQVDVKGFRGASWGISLDSVKAIFSNEITLLETPQAYFNAYCPLTIENYIIDQQSYTVDFIFSNETNVLTQVNIASKRLLNWGLTVNSLESILTEKYGVPTFRGVNPYVVKWTFESSKITLHYLRNLEVIKLIYEPNDNENKSKL